MKSKLPVILTQDEEMKLLGKFNTRYVTSHRNMLMIKLSLATGLRISEVLNLRWEEMEPEQGAIKLRILDSKGGKDRILFMAPGLYEEILDYSEKHSQDRIGVVFRTTKGKPVKDLYTQNDASEGYYSRYREDYNLSQSPAYCINQVI